MKKWMVLLGAMMMFNMSAKAVQVGDAAPAFKAASTAGRELSLQDFKGQWLVMYFYPKSFTPGCTAESCSLRDGYGAIQAEGAVILGVSLDKLETQNKFKAEHQLPFDLLSDPDGAVAKAFDVLALGGFMAKRVTFIINPEGRVARVLDDVKTGSHDGQVLAALQALKKP